MNDSAPPEGAEALPGAPVASPVEMLSYNGRAGDLAKITISNALLTLVTLGIYRFWGKTRVRRYVWGHVRFLGDRLEYSGTGSELFIGFLIAMLILAPLIAVSIGVEIAYAEDLGVVAIKETIQLLILVFLIQVAIYRARRYRLTRTQWRGIRAGQTGSSLKYALMAFGWSLVTALTLGLAYNVYRTRTQAYRLNHTWFGDRAVTFRGLASDLFGTWFMTWLFLIPTAGLIYIWYRVKEFRYFASRTRYGGLSFQSELSGGRVFLIYIIYSVCLGVLVLVLGSLIAVLLPSGIIAGMAVGSAGNPLGEGVGPELGAIAGVVAVFAVAAVTLGLLQILLFVHPLLKAAVNSLGVIGEEDFAKIAQSQQAVPGRGEGLADTLDVAPF